MPEDTPMPEDTATPRAEIYQAACHCRAVRFEVQLEGGMASARRCTCSYCTMRGAVAVSAALDGIRFIAGGNALTCYRFNTGEAKHYFCATCGIYTHHQRRSNPQQYGINLACLEGHSPFDLPEIPVFDGVNHPRDSKAPARIAGTLRYTANTQPLKFS